MTTQNDTPTAPTICPGCGCPLHQGASKKEWLPKRGSQPSKRNPNFGRRYVSCCSRTCNFFQWVEPPKGAKPGAGEPACPKCGSAVYRGASKKAKVKRGGKMVDNPNYQRPYTSCSDRNCDYFEWTGESTVEAAPALPPASTPEARPALQRLSERIEKATKRHNAAISSAHRYSLNEEQRSRLRTNGEKLVAIAEAVASPDCRLDAGGIEQIQLIVNDIAESSEQLASGAATAAHLAATRKATSEGGQTRAQAKAPSSRRSSEKQPEGQEFTDRSYEAVEEEIQRLARKEEEQVRTGAKRRPPVQQSLSLAAARAQFSSPQ